MGMILPGKDGNVFFWQDMPEFKTMPKQSVWNKIKRWIRKIFGVTTFEFINGSKVLALHGLEPVRGSVKVYTMDDNGHIGPAFQLDPDTLTR